MATETPINIASLITCTPGVVGGEPCIAGTRMPVKKIAALHNQGLLAEEIVARWQHLTLARVHAALAYYYANKRQIDEALEADQHLGNELLTRYPRGNPPRP